MARNTSYLSGPNVSAASQEEVKKVFGEKVRSLMNNLSMNQSDLARTAGLKRDSISTYIRGKAFPDPANLQKLARALDVTPSDLIPGMSEIEESPAKAPGHRPSLHSAPPATGIQMEQVKPGFFRLRFDQVLPFADASKILAILNEGEK